MKRFLAYSLVLALAIGMLTACASAPTNGGQTDEPVTGDAPSGTTVGDGDAAGRAPIEDILEGLPYELLCLDGESDLGDDGKLNDGVFRTTDELTADSDADTAVAFAGGVHRYQIVFDIDGRHLAHKLVFHNVLAESDIPLVIDAVELGDTSDNLEEVAYEMQTTETVSGYADVSVIFEVETVNALRVTFSSDADRFQWEEITLIGVSGVEASAQSEAATTATTALHVAASLVGTWIGQDPEYPDSDVVLSFSADGSGSYSQESLTLGFSWSTDGYAVTMNMDMFGMVKNGNYDAVSDMFTLPDEEGNTTIFTRLE